MGPQHVFARNDGGRGSDFSAGATQRSPAQSTASAHGTGATAPGDDDDGDDGDDGHDDDHHDDGHDGAGGGDDGGDDNGGDNGGGDDGGGDNGGGDNGGGDPDPNGGHHPNPPDPPDPPRPDARMGTLGGSRTTTDTRTGPGIVISGKGSSLSAARHLVDDLGGRIFRVRTLGSVGLGLASGRLPFGMSVESFKTILAENKIDVTAAENATYTQSAGPDTNYAATLVGLPPDSPPCGAAAPAPVGLIDGPIERGNAALKGVNLQVRNFAPEGGARSNTNHATALAGLIAAPGPAPGASGRQVPRGIAPGAPVFAAVAFSKIAEHEVAYADTIASSLDWLITSRVRIVNMSLTGPDNEVLSQIIGLAASGGVVIFAASGNDGASQAAFPASDPNVLSVTAVDADRRLYRKANRGKVDFAAPGVDLLVAGQRGASYRTGTSYASAIAAALAARDASGGAVNLAAVTRQLRAGAIDLGAPGRDDQFGWGLVQARCN